MARDESTSWDEVARLLEQALEGARTSGDEALSRLSHRIEAELIDLRYQRTAGGD